MFTRDWWKRRFGNVLGAPVKRDEFEHCTACGQPFNIRDLYQALPHFEHQLALAPRPLQECSPDEDLPSPAGTVVPLRRPATDVALGRSMSQCGMPARKR
jgi:hypothetical protein